MKGLLYLPFNTPEACIEQIQRYGHLDSIIGFTVCSTRNKPVHHNNDRCTEGNNIERENWQSGTGGKLRCEECTRLAKQSRL
jgi:hypothetical protein